jgi:hypothetical protein
MRENWKAPHKTIPVAMALLTILVASMLYKGPASVGASSRPVIDVFDNATPSGMGINESSGPFAPQQLVILYANVTYNGAPVENKLVAFEVTDPTGNIIFSGSNATDAYGIATVRFRLATNATFGTWTVIGSVDVAQVVVHDYLWFSVGWIIMITNITTLNAELKLQTVFHRQDVIVFNLTLENTALTNKTCTITVDVKDAAQYSIIQLELTNLTLTPGKNYVLTPSREISITAAIGLATVSAAPYTAPIESGGVLYSPAISTTFEIALVQVPDIAVTNIKLSSTSVFIGQTVQINVTVANTGTEAVAFNVSTYYNSSFLIETISVSVLEPASQVTLTFTWNTAAVTEGYYQISASAPLPGDPTPLDNTLVDGFVQVKTKPLYPPLPPLPFALLWLIVFAFIVAVIASLLLLLLLLFFCLRRRRKKNAKRYLYTAFIYPHR